MNKIARFFSIIGGIVLLSGAAVGIAVGAYYGVKNAQKNQSNPISPSPSDAITEQSVNPQTQFIYEHETPVIFALIPDTPGVQKEFVISGTAWVFDVANYTNSDPLLRTYYLATNHHVIDFTKSILSFIQTTKQNIRDGKQQLQPNSFPYGTDAQNLKFFVKMMLPKYQFGTNPKQVLSQENVDSSPNYYNFLTSSKNDLIFSSNYLFYSGVTGQYTSLNYPIFQNLPTRNFNFTVNNLTWTNVIDKLGLKNSAADADIGFIQLSFNANATDADIPNVIKNFNSYYLTLNKYINPFAINPVPSNDKYYIGGFPAISDKSSDLRWVSPSSTATPENPSGGISINLTDPTYFGILNANGQTVNAFAYNKGQGYLGAYTYIFPGLNLNHGSSGSMVTNAEHQIIGIYWGGIKTTNLANHQSSFKGAVISFSENKIIPIWNQYYKQFLAPITQGTPTNFLSYFITKTNS